MVGFHSSEDDICYISSSGIMEHICQDQYPRAKLTDCGSQFYLKMMKEFYDLLEVQYIKTTPYHPQCNGTIEQMQRTLKSVLRKCCAEGRDWVPQLPYTLFALGQMPLAELRYTLFDLVHGSGRGPHLMHSTIALLKDLRCVSG